MAKHAELVWDGGDPMIPMGMAAPPAEGQMAGTQGERLVELATRVCYDSLGCGSDGRPRGRPTKETLANVVETGHHSVLEHFVRTLELKPDTGHRFTQVMQAFLGRPGTHLRVLNEGGPIHFRMTVNLRAVVEWGKWSEALAREHGIKSGEDIWYSWLTLGQMLRAEFHKEAPLLCGPADVKLDDLTPWLTRAGFGVVEPETDAERHVTLYLVGSRGFSHEQVRHRFAMSQRSTRYCEESSSPWHLHPLIMRYIEDRTFDSRVGMIASTAPDRARLDYMALVDDLEAWLLERLPEDTPYRKKHARKQARGAARGLLGNALQTEMFFTAPVWAWRHMVNMRAAEAADAEIRVVISDALHELKLSRYADRFEDLELVDAADGMGRCLKGGGHA